MTVDDLEKYILSILSERDRLYSQRIQDQERAIGKAEVATEKRLESVNEFRAQQTEILALTLPRREADQRLGEIATKLSALENRMQEALARVHSRLDLNEGRSRGFNAGWGYLVALGGFVAAIATTIAIIFALNG